ncbi:hypothetical protein [Alteromonas sp. a30]|uniref:hypothetical protein n=1 Tax=Alteromonas sp. a30 TaxID=2730917 RepID=UPI002280C15F|nr:hypothetical protein [Alteromonas sp. a30]MCY7297303.1 hypothetical protein [Alteromonas sp. a30]
MSQSAQTPRHGLRDNFGKALGVLCALYFVAQAHAYTVEYFLLQIRPFIHFGHDMLWSLLWGLCVFYVLVMGVRFIFAAIIGAITTLLSIIAVRISLPRKRG